MAKDKFSQEDLDLLTPSERAAMEDPELEEDDSDNAPEVGEEKAAAEVEAKADTQETHEEEAVDGEEDGNEEETEKESGAAEQKEKPAAEASAAEDGKGGDEADDEGGSAEAEAADEDFAPSRKPRNYLTDEGAKKQIKEIDDKLEDLERRYDDGEEGLDRPKYARMRRELEDARIDIKDGQRESRQVLQTWRDETVPAFMSAHPEYRSSAMLTQALDAKVRAIQTSGTYDPFDPVVLKKAHAEVQKELKALGVASAPKAEKTQEKKKPAAKAPKPATAERPAPPPNIGSLPSAETAAEADGGKYAYLDRLEGVAYEDALAKLSDEEQDAYLASR